MTKWKKAPKRKNAAVDPMIKQPLIFPCSDCRNKNVEKQGDRCLACMMKKEKAKTSLEKLDEEYNAAFKKHKHL